MNAGDFQSANQPRWLALALAQGIVVPALFAGIVIVGGALRPGYSHFSQAISELTEAGAPNKAYLDWPLFLMEMLTIVFAVGFFQAARSLNRHLRISALLLVVIGFVGLFFLRFPMDPMGTVMTPDGRMHLIIVSVSAVAAIAAVSFSGIGGIKIPGQKWFGRFSFFVLVVMLGSGAISAVVGISGWSGIGLWQRVNNGAFSIWQIAAAVCMLKYTSTLKKPKESSAP